MYTLFAFDDEALRVTAHQIEGRRLGEEASAQHGGVALICRNLQDTSLAVGYYPRSGKKEGHRDLQRQGVDVFLQRKR